MKKITVSYEWHGNFESRYSQPEIMTESDLAARLGDHFIHADEFVRDRTFKRELNDKGDLCKVDLKIREYVFLYKVDKMPMGYREKHRFIVTEL